ncbi:ACT domain-containing protein [Brevibacillus massiliensis]|jgi:L-serine dehydratase|uniref:ACT domain-containing protein n=1 Tax=Brevibacillus massiliensis TaxID=1118054 RepID=UPI0004746A43|nr:ACT domain-containing protein [Brevibacillus massiliensis]
MTDYAGLRSLAGLIHRFEPALDGAVLTILAAEQRQEITRLLLDGLADVTPRPDVKVEASSGEYASHIAVLRIGNRKYTFAKDYRETFISEIGEYSCRITPDANGVLVYHIDYPGVVRDVSRILAEYMINISKLNVSREQKGKNALLVSLTDEAIPPDVIAKIDQLPNVTKVISLR